MESDGREWRGFWCLRHPDLKLTGPPRVIGQSQRLVPFDSASQFYNGHSGVRCKASISLYSHFEQCNEYELICSGDSPVNVCDSKWHVLPCSIHRRKLAADATPFTFAATPPMPIEAFFATGTPRPLDIKTAYCLTLVCSRRETIYNCILSRCTARVISFPANSLERTETSSAVKLDK